MKLVEAVRQKFIAHALSNKSFRKQWDERRALIERALTERSQGSYFDLGGGLSDVFRLDIRGDRSQGGVSAGGNIWELLVSYYLNLGYAGTGAIVLRNKANIPSSVIDALTVSHQGTYKLSDLDSLLIMNPRLNDEVVIDGKDPVGQFKKLIDRSFSETTVIVIQCKTNWNDNSQTPMLWNMVFGFARNKATPPGQLTIGRKMYVLSGLKDFAYAFVTVPTNDRSNFKSDSMPVRRVATMTGGYYWGYPEKSGVCEPLSEFFSFNCRGDMPGPELVGKSFMKWANGDDVEDEFSYFGLNLRK